MLVLTRKRGEAVVIDENVRVTVIDVQGSRVRIGFEAPADVRIRREELPNAVRDAGHSGRIPLPMMTCVTRPAGDSSCSAPLRRSQFATKPR